MNWQIKRSADRLDPVAEIPAVAAALRVPATAGQTQDPRLLDLKVRVHRQLLERLNLSLLDKLPRDQIEAEVTQVVVELLEADGAALNKSERVRLVDDVLDELLGLGPLEPLLEDETITDILVNGPNTVFVERRGLLERVATRFQDENFAYQEL